ncbi:hypothetical protein [Novosphingobium sp.]|jgi:hypothetical protein|uniref:hypothetical protein n=1 Tax=Novosphingobium sp. TaxID=1874826 RepID=UPI0028B0FEC5|nr:hypothetical protein [Novosphingobium sp.]
MSDDRRPAKVRVFSSGSGGPSNPVAPNPGRRRTDAPQVGVDGAGAQAVKRGGALWVVFAVILFLIGSALGGVLFTMSVLFPGALL